MDTRAAIVQNVCINEILLKRKTQLDQLVEGLSSLGFLDFLATFKEELCSLVQTTVDDLMGHINIIPQIPTDGAAAYNTYQHFLLVLKRTKMVP